MLSLNRVALCAVVFAMFFQQQTMAQYTIKLPYQDFGVENVGGRAVFKGGFPNQKPGQPALPSYTVTFLLPPNADLKGVRVDIVSPVESELSGQYDVAPCELFPSERAGKYPTVVDGKDTMVYRKDAFFPSEYKGKENCASMRQYKVVTVPVNAYRYNPVTKKLRTISGGTLEITFAFGGSSSAFTVRDARAEKILGMRVVNPSIFEIYGTAPMEGAVQGQSMQSVRGAIPGIGTTKPATVPPSLAATNFNAAQPLAAGAGALSVSGHGYYVLTTDYIANNSAALNFFLYYAVTARGGTPKVFTVESLTSPGRTGQDRADDLKNWLASVYLNDNVNNLLIIGSPDLDNGDIPMKLYGSYPTDFYYADMNDPMDGAAEIAVGRIPAAYINGTLPGGVPFNMSEIDDILYRTTNYCFSSGASNEWRRLAMLPIVPLGDGWADNNYFNFGENCIIAKIKANAAGWQFHRLYEPFDGKYLRAFINGVSIMNPLPEAPFCNPDIVPLRWNTYIPGLVVYNTHGCPSHAALVLGTDDKGYYKDGEGNTILIPGSVTYLNPAYPAVVFAASCGTAPPETSFAEWDGTGKFFNHLGYQTLVHNAVAYIGASREIGQPTNQSVGQGFVDYMTRKGTNCSAGEALNLARSGMDEVLLFNLWGCPNVSFNLDDFSSTLGIPQNFKPAPYSGNPKTQIRITWSSVTGATSYVIEKADAGTPLRDYFYFLAEVSSTAYTDINLPNATKYKYRMYAKSSSGRGAYSIIDSASTYDASNNVMSPNTPTNLTVQNGKDCGTIFSWSPATSGQFASSFNIQRSTTNTASSFVTIANVYYRVPSFTDTNLVNGKTYYYRVSGVNDYGQSAFPSAVSAAPASPGDGNVAAPTAFYLGCPSPPSNVNCVYFSWVNSSSMFNYIGSMIEYMEQMPDGSYAAPSDNGWANQWNHFVIGDRWERDNNNSQKSYSTQTGSWFSEGCFIQPRGNVQYRFRIRNFTHPGSDSTVYHYSPALTQDIKLNTDDSKINSNQAIWATSGGCSQNGPESLLLTWQYYPIDFDATYYKIYYKVGTGPWQSGTSSGYTYSMQVGSSKTVSCYVRPCYSKNNVDIDGPYSANLVLKTDNTVTVPIYFRITPLCGTAIQLDWVSTSMNNPAPVFKIDRKVGTGSWTVNAYTTASGVGAMSFVNTGLTPSTQYSYRIRAYLNGGYSAYTPILTAMTFIATAQDSTPGYHPNKAIDNNTGTQWLASSTTKPKWWQVNLNDSIWVGGAQIKWTTSGAWKYKIDASKNGTAWTNLLAETTAKSQTTTDYFNNYSRWKYLKVTITGGPSNVKAGIYEFTIK